MQLEALPESVTVLGTGAVGMTEAEARAMGLDVVVAVKQLPATLAGPQGGEVLGLLNLAVHARLPLAELRSMIYPFPTFYGGIGEALGAYGRGLATVIDPGYRDFLALDAAGRVERSGQQLQ